MSFLWLAAWLIRRRPTVQMFRKWNNWGIALGVCLAIDLMSGMGRTASSRGGRFKEIAGRGKAKKIEEGAKLEPVSVQ